MPVTTSESDSSPLSEDVSAAKTTNDAGIHEMQLQGPNGLQHRQLVEVKEGSSAEGQTPEELLKEACADLAAAKALPKFTKLVTDPALATKAPADAKLHVITAYESLGQACPGVDQRGVQQKARVDGNYGVMRVKVSEPNVALYLSSYQPVTWWIDVTASGSVASIAMVGYHQSSIVGVPSTVAKVLTSSYDGGQNDVTTFIRNFEQSYERVYSEKEERWVCGTEPRVMKEGDYEADQKMIKKLTGLAQLTSIQALYQGSTFLVSPETRGQLTTTQREALHCYREADGSVQEYLPVE